jgi:translation initiation factor IF-3
MTHQEIGRRLMERLLNDLNEIAEVEKAPKMEGYALVAIFAPKRG